MPLVACWIVASGDDERDLVRRGYDQLSYHYRRDDAEDGHYGPWLADLHQRLPASSAVLDLGCGCGIPAARFLTDCGHQVTGVDISEVQIDRARRLVPAASFLCADAAQVRLPPASFDAVVCLYALIHMPLAEQPPLLERIATWLRPGGWLLVTTGHEPTRERIQSQADRERFDDTTKCILCAACTSSCPVFWTDGQYFGPAAIVNAHRFIFDSRDEGADLRLEILNDKEGVWRCRTTFNCSEACPRGIEVTKAIQEVKRALLARKI